jgi:hypothetical protein
MSSPVNDELSRSLRDVMNTSQFAGEFASEPIIEEKVVEVFVPVYEKEIVEVPQVCRKVSRRSIYSLRFNMWIELLRCHRSRSKRK